MKIFLVIFLLTGLAFSQSKYTVDDEAFSAHIKEIWNKTNTNNYKEYFTNLLTECNNYLKVHPNSAIKPGVLGYIFEMKAAISSDPRKVSQAGDVLLKYDDSFKTSLRVAQILIEKKLDDKKGIEIIKGIITKATAKSDYYDANLLLASGELHLKNYQKSINALNAAIKSDSSRVDGYKGLVQVLPLAGEKIGLAEAKAKLNALDKDPNIGVDISSFSIYDIYENKVDFKNFRGSLVVMIFFRFECPYCRREMPVFSELIKKHPEIKFIFVNLEESVSDIKFKFLKEDEFSFMKDQTIVKFIDKFDKILDITITPQTLILDKNTIVKVDYRGYQENFVDKFESDINDIK